MTSPPLLGGFVFILYAPLTLKHNDAIIVYVDETQRQTKGKKMEKNKITPASLKSRNKTVKMSRSMTVTAENNHKLDAVLAYYDYKMRVGDLLVMLVNEKYKFHEDETACLGEWKVVCEK